MTREEIKVCPYCGENCWAEWVDNGVGLEQCGPYCCRACGAAEIDVFGMFDNRTLSENEKETGWYEPR